MSEVMFGTGEKKISTESVTVATYHYLKVKDGICANCGHSTHNEEKVTTGSEIEGAVSPEEYNRQR
jgi:hypothetical protein